MSVGRNSRGGSPYVAVTTRGKGYTSGTRIFAENPEHAVERILELRGDRDGKHPVREVRIYEGHFDPKLAGQMIPILVRDMS